MYIKTTLIYKYIKSDIFDKKYTSISFKYSLTIYLHNCINTYMNVVYKNANDRCFKYRYLELVLMCTYVEVF